MKISVVCVGKIKEKFYKDAIDEYSKRLSKYCKLEIIEVQDEKTPDGASETVEEQIRRTEGARILKAVPGGAYMILLAINGRQMSSPELSEEIEKLTVRGVSNIAFVIGGSLGTSKEVYSRADAELSFSKMTFPHQLMRVVLLEQIYRSFKISAGEPYHK
ncbi:MAG: 23S rRNA (pseudouridine(1915)-N(3))-methyltransferase RlmH [Lachnospiraceae bacterium]|nr:23S rRNA (pseudouridine(1915)-N(3))-methyltransferase RlmH [Lachnospiraceae bacterium]